MPSLNELGLTEEAAPQVDWDAPEPGKTPPPVFPGLYTILFRMPEDREEWFDKVERTVSKDANGKEIKGTFLEVHYGGDIIAQNEAAIAAEDGSALKLPPQRANTFKSGKMLIHQVGELIRGMGVRIEGSLLGQIQDVLAQLDGKAHFKAELIWRAYFKNTDTTISTSPRKGKGNRAAELAWPRNAQGEFELLAVDPKSGEKAYGYLEIARVKAPEMAAAS